MADETLKSDSLGTFLVIVTERLLSHRKYKRFMQRKKARARGWILDTFLTLVGAIIWVFFINQYLIQAYVIPSGSMIPTLLINDRIFVDKFFYGPPILPGAPRFPALASVHRADVIVFENPEYNSRGTLFEIVHRLLYTFSFTKININTNAWGEPEVDLLIKRAVGFNGDRIRFQDGNLEIKPQGMSEWMTEAQFIKQSSLNYMPMRQVPNNDGEAKIIAMLSELSVYRRAGLAPPAHLQPYDELYLSYNYNQHRVEVTNQTTKSRARFMLNPHRSSDLSAYYRQYYGIYVPHGYVLPLGDNRDNSLDGRFFGVVEQRNILGRALWRFLPLWPQNRFGIVE
jgi:signal peptidase I